MMHLFGMCIHYRCWGDCTGGDNMMHLFVGMLLGILVGLAVGSACASLAWAKAEIRRLKRELRKEYGYADEQK